MTQVVGVLTKLTVMVFTCLSIQIVGGGAYGWDSIVHSFVIILYSCQNEEDIHIIATV